METPLNSYVSQIVVGLSRGEVQRILGLPGDYCYTQPELVSFATNNVLIVGEANIGGEQEF